MNRTKLITISILLLSSVLASAQYLDDEPSYSQRIFWGGGFGFTLGSVTHVDVSPIIGYRITNRLSAGVGGIYQFFKYPAYNVQTSIYGAKVFTSVTLIKDLSNIFPFGENMGGLLLHAEFEEINIEKGIFSLSQDNERIWVSCPLAGLGYQLPIGRRSYMIVYVLLNLYETQDSPYGNPVFRMSFQF